MTELQDEVRAIHKKYRLRITSRATAAAAAHNALVETVQSNPSLFEKPRTRIIHGIKVGYRKQVGSVDWDDDDQVVRRILKHPDLEGQFDLLVKTTYSPIKTTIAELDGNILKRLGVTVHADGDRVVVKPVDTEIDKIVKAYLAELTEEPEPEPVVVAGR